jgi:gas vesicle protein
MREYDTGMTTGQPYDTGMTGGQPYEPYEPYETYGGPSHGRMVGPSVDYRMIVGAVLGGLLLGAMVLMYLTPQGRRLRHQLMDHSDHLRKDANKRLHHLSDEAGKRLDKMSAHGRGSLEDVLARTRDELSGLEEMGRERVGDLRHRASTLRRKQLLRRLERELMS